ncbi:MAG: hypothetical protein LUE99_13060 [Bacteroides sp.]|nr:hypothetical protein [Bacteroides sp.]
MKPFVTLCTFLLLLPIGNLQAGETGELSTLCHQAAVRKNLEGYSAVCRYLSERKEQPELLLVYADSIRQLALRTKSTDCFIEYYIWNSAASFIKGNHADGYALKRKALSLAERAGRKAYIVSCSADIGRRFNMDGRFDSARYYLKKGMDVAESKPEFADKYRILLTDYARALLYEGQTDSALVYTLEARKRSQANKDTATLIENLNQLGTIYRRKKNMGDCMLNFEKALQLCEAQQNFKIAAFIYGNIATAYGDCDRSREAVAFAEKAVEYALEMK